MRIDLGETELEGHSRNRICSARLLQALRKHHPEVTAAHAPVGARARGPRGKFQRRRGYDSALVPALPACVPPDDEPARSATARRFEIAELAADTAISIGILPLAATPITVEAIKRVVCRHFGISHTQIISPLRNREFARPRQIAMYLCREYTTRSLPDIARRFGDRDHTTCIAAVRKVSELMQSDKEFLHHVRDLRAQLDA